MVADGISKGDEGQKKEEKRENKYLVSLFLAAIGGARGVPPRENVGLAA